MINLNKREARALTYVNMLLGGYNLKEIAEEVHLSFRTIEMEFNIIRQRFSVTKIEHAIGKMIKLGIINEHSIIFKQDHPIKENNSGACLECHYNQAAFTITGKIVFI